MKNLKLSNHSKQRMVERSGTIHKNQRILFRNAIHNGISINSQGIPDKIRKYIASKGNANVRIYQGYVFIYSKWKRQLYTMYEAPEWVKEELKNGKM